MPRTPLAENPSAKVSLVPSAPTPKEEMLLQKCILGL